MDGDVSLARYAALGTDSLDRDGVTMRFLHTADWQLGMTRHFLDDDAQPRYTAARVEVIGRLGKIAAEQGCEFILVCGDVFESNHLSLRVIKRSLEAMGALDIPIYLLPGNHDPLDAASVYRNQAFVSACPANVHVLDGTDVVRPVEGVELIGAPWFSKHPNRDLVAQALNQHAEEPAAQGIVRIVAGHGIVDVLSPDRDDASVISFSDLEAAVSQRRAHYIALGDRHSFTNVSDSGFTWYPSAPEVTDFDDVEINSGHVLVVDMADPSAPKVESHAVGQWRFITLREEFSSDHDVERVLTILREIPDKERTVLRYGFTGTLSLVAKARLDAGLESLAEVFAALNPWRRHMDLAVYVDDEQLADLGVGGFIAPAVKELNELAREAEDPAARDALSLLYRLSGGVR